MEAISDSLEKVRLVDPPSGSDPVKPQGPEEAETGAENEAENEAEKEQLETRIPVTPFRFFDLPSEIRLRIFSFVLFTPRRKKVEVHTKGSVGASSKKNPELSPVPHRVNLFLASRRMHDEASDFFYSTQTFRLFSLQDYSRMPTVRSIPPRYRPSVATIELILGSSWTAPPKSWKITKNLGLEEMVRARTLKVFIEVDPSHPVFEGFRISKGFYTGFAGGLLQEILKRMPRLDHVEFDGWPSVRKNGALMQRLLHEVRAAGKKIAWGPERGWTDLDEEESSAPLVYELPSTINKPKRPVSPQPPSIFGP
ncbi:hypothetical protein BDV25DRAFT_163000 [Aspergillus avenaceus]|uniref:F-box domain-containing protein n=1 Tax=Aspergillus avenaceus TaxID=36643 RepID=A0A5N6TIU7_ASPAV|nr:hypothetical protein BDV25DRAFT_163000 [Aspergillus avenaceus]